MSGGWAWIRARFSFKGRASRKEYWLAIPAIFLCFFLGIALTFAVAIMLSLVFAYFHVTADPFIPAIPIVMMLLTLVLYMWLGIAISIRRAHDLGYSWRESLQFRTNTHAAFKRGTAGPNQYGPDPLQKPAPPE